MAVLLYLRKMAAVNLCLVLQFPSLQSLTALLRAGKFVYDGDELNMSFPEASVRDSDNTDNILDDSATHLPEEVPTLLTLGPVQEATYEEVMWLNLSLGGRGSFIVTSMP